MATTNEHLPEDIIIEILYRLPVKPLIRFSCVSKRWSTIVWDPQFAKSHLRLASERKTLSQRILISAPSQLESVDAKTPSFSSVRKLAFPFKQPGRTVQTLGSCNGMVFVALDLHDSFYIWNPSTGLFRTLPNPGFASIGVTTFHPSIGDFDPSKRIVRLHHYGFGYVSAIDDYKLVVAAQITNFAMPVEIFSSKADSWKRIESPPHFFSLNYISETSGRVRNEALHWLHGLLEPEPDELVIRYTIAALDLGKEEFREIALPPVLSETVLGTEFLEDVGIVFEGCLCVSSYERMAPGGEYIQLWVMMEYDVRESWTKLFKLFFLTKKLFKLDMFNYCHLLPIFYKGRGIVILSKARNSEMVDELTWFDHKEEEKLDKVAVCTGRYRLEMGSWGHCCMIEYDESLLWLHDSRAVV